MTESIGTVEELAGAVAANLRQYGHYQGVSTVRHGGGVGHCVYTAGRWLVGHDLTATLAGRILDIDARGMNRLEALYRWNDSTPTAEVLATLDAIAGAPAVIAEAESALHVVAVQS